MELLEAMERRHSVRSYEDRPLEPEVRAELTGFLAQCSRESGLHMQLVLNEPNSFSGLMAHYGKFSGVQNYIAVVGKKGSELEKKSGYFGEKVVLYAQSLGLNTCWVAMTYSKIKGAYEVKAGEKLCCVISIGYGVNQGVSHKVKKVEELCQVNGQMPQWFRAGVEAAQLAPTAMNQQKFYFVLKEDQVAAKTKAGFYTNVDLGIAKYHFEIGAGVGNDWKWAQ